MPFSLNPTCLICSIRSSQEEGPLSLTAFVSHLGKNAPIPRPGVRLGRLASPRSLPATCGKGNQAGEGWTANDPTESRSLGAVVALFGEPQRSVDILLRSCTRASKHSPDTPFLWIGMHLKKRLDQPTNKAHHGKAEEVCRRLGFQPHAPTLRHLETTLQALCSRRVRQQGR